METGFDPFALLPLYTNGKEISLEKCFGEGNAFPCGPVCEFRGLKIPTLVQWSEHGGITGEILTNILKRMDSCGAIDRTDDNVKPFLLVDAHNSRLSVEFLKYINNTNHKWFVCIGVPYGTHLWQVADAEQLNGELSRLFTIGKEDLLRKKTHHGMAPSITRTDVMPLFTPAWKSSFGDVEMNLKAMAVRGWSVLNYALLDHPEIRKEMTLSDIKSEYSEVFGMHHGEQVPSDAELSIRIRSAKLSPPTGLTSAQSPVGVIGVDDLNFSGGLGKRVVDDLVAGDMALQARATVRKRAK